MKNGHGRATSPVLCEHANECPAVCRCDADCYCRGNTCNKPPKAKRKRKAIPSWWITCNESGESLPVPGVPQDRWFAARAIGVSLLGAKLGKSVSQDAVKVTWVES